MKQKFILYYFILFLWRKRFSPTEQQRLKFVMNLLLIAFIIFKIHCIYFIFYKFLTLAVLT